MDTTTALAPIVSEFETQKRAVSYDRWFRAKVQQAIDSQNEAMARVNRLLDERRKQRAVG